MGPYWHKGSLPAAIEQTLRLVCLPNPCGIFRSTRARNMKLYETASWTRHHWHLVHRGHPELPPNSLCHFQWQCRSPQLLRMLASWVLKAGRCWKYMGTYGHVWLLAAPPKCIEAMVERPTARPGSRHSFLDSGTCKPWLQFLIV